jgi:hypothetical protein
MATICALVSSLLTSICLSVSSDLDLIVDMFLLLPVMNKVEEEAIANVIIEIMIESA